MSPLRKSDSPPDRLGALVEVLMSMPTDLLRQVDFANMALGSFLKEYASQPDAVDLGSRSSIREDTVVREVARLLSETSAVVRILDACCGFGTVARRVARGLSADDSARVSYLAVDRDTGCVRALESDLDHFACFATFRVMQRDVCDVGDVERNSIHLVVMNNTLHEIPPRVFSQMFAAFNSLLYPDLGRICIVDMEELPIDAPEAIAITWQAAEVQQFLSAGGFSPEISVHDKSTSVFQAHARKVSGVVDVNAMREELKRLIQAKLTVALKSRRQLEAKLNDVDDYKQWVVLTGSIARYLDELFALGAVLN